MNGLDAFASSFAVPLLAAVPELREHARVEKGALRIELQPGPARADSRFWISTLGDEVTVAFGMFHAHFDWPVEGEWPDDPIEFIKSIMSDETLIEDWTLDGKWCRSGTLAADEEPDLSEMQAGHVIHVRSWSGLRDRTIRGK